MTRRSTIVFFLASVFICQAQSKVNVTIYYETHCPDSQRIMRDGIGKSLDLINEVHFELVPYGKASTLGSAGSHTFQCQHGAKECEGNTYHACAIDQHSDKKQLYSFAICTMSYGNDVLNKIEDCAKQNSIDYEKLKACAKGAKGGDLLAAEGRKTRAGANKITGKSRLDFVPSTLIDGHPKVYEAYRNLRTAVCDHGKVKPNKC